MKNYTDERGTIQEITNDTIKTDGIQYITSKAGARRAGHYHKTSGHHCILTKGALTYYERIIIDGKSGKDLKHKPVYYNIKAPAIFYTGPMVEHLMVFTEDSEMMCLRTNGSKNHEDYENDLVRIDINLDEI